MLAAGRRLCDDASSDVSQAATGIKTWAEERSTLEKLLGIEASGAGSIKVAMTILTPLLATSLSYLLGEKR
jgi:hypothetical protein